jgi:phosphoglycolate phosphatase-like HAD superfamily hydrolase
MKDRALVFDVDGVLIDTQRSFPNVVKTAIQWWSRFRLGMKVDASPFSLRHYQIAKNHGSFNDDYDIAWTFLSLIASLGESRLSDCRLSSEDWGKILNGCEVPNPVPWVYERYGNLVPRDELRELCEEIYFGADMLGSARGRTPASITMRGLWNQERPALGVSWRRLGLPVGIYTGRSRAELSLALSLLGWTDLPAEACVTIDEGIAKPSPEGFIRLEETLGFEKVLFFGDTASDRLAFEGYGKGRFIPIGPLFAGEKNAAKDLPEALSRELPELVGVIL